MKCLKCGAEIPQGSLFCRECGEKVEVRSKRFCRECGAELAEGAKFCSGCGASIEIAKGKVVEQTPQVSEESTYSPKIKKPDFSRVTETANRFTEAGQQMTRTVQSSFETNKKQPQKKKSLIAVVALVVVLLIISLVMGLGSSKKSDSSNHSSNSKVLAANQTFDEIVPVVLPSATIEPGTEFAYMADAWNVYIAKAVSSNVIKVESWHKSSQSDKKMKLNGDLGSFKIDDEANGFMWIDKEHTAFTLTIQDKNNSEVKKPTAVVFTINISNTDTDKGTDYDNKIACYEYVNDDWHTYRAIALTDSLVKIECWYRTSSGFWESHRFGWDVGIIDLNNTNTDFEWGDDKHNAFTITMIDPANGSNWKEEKLTSFILANEGYKHSTVLSFLGKADNSEEESSNATPQMNGFDSKTNKQYLLGNYTVEIPTYWASEKKITDGKQWYAETGGKVAMLQVTCSPETDDKYEVTFDGLMDDNDNMIKMIEATAFKEVTGFEVVDTGTAKGILYKGTLESEGLKGVGYWFAFPSEDDRCWCAIIYCQTENTEYLYDEDYLKMISSIKKVTATSSALESTKEPEPETTKAPETVSYSSNTKDTVKNGNTGVYSYKNRGGSYDIYYIIDFDEGYVYYFCDGNGDGTCDRVKIDSGTLNDVVIITYHDGGDTWQEGLHFKWSKQPDHLIMEDHNHFEWDFYTTDLNDALVLRDSKTIYDY